MIINYTELEFENAKSTELLALICKTCGKIFYKKKSEIKHELENKERNRCCFCSQECHHENQKTIDLEYKCAECGKTISRKEYEIKKSKTNKFFCSQSCAAKYNNKIYVKRTKSKHDNIQTTNKNFNSHKLFITKTKIDNFTNDELIDMYTKSQNILELCILIGYSKTSLSRARKILIKKLLSLGLEVELPETPINISNISKGSTFKRYKAWQTARTMIRKDAYRVYINNGGELKCAICGYDKHADVAHIKSVSSFDDDVLISEINDFKNLIGLCPNHHWEFDAGLIDAIQYKK